MELSFGQRIDPINGYIQPWFTHGSLDEIAAMDLSDKIVLMYGAGLGDMWLAKRCKKLYVIERDIDWYNSCQLNNDGSIAYIFRPCTDCNGHDEFYLTFPDGIEPDIIISDDAYRTEAVEKAINYFKQKGGGGILICDNYWQDFVWKSPKAIEMLEPFEKHIHLCTTHTDHEGDPWKTAIILI